MLSATRLLGRRHFAAFTKRVGLVGAGGVGTAVAQNLARGGVRVAAFTDKNPAAGAAVAGLGAERCDTPRAVAEKSDVVITALTTPAVVRSCMLGPEGVLAGLAPGALWVDHSTTDYHQTLELAARCKENGQLCLEAPVTGGLTLLQEGKMTVFLGGDKQVFEDHRALFEPSFGTILYLGEMGAATITKVVTNLLAGANTVLAGEALVIAKKAGIDLPTYFDAVRTSAGNSYVWETEVPLVFNQTFDPGFHIDLHVKDFGLGQQITHELGVPNELFSLTGQKYMRAMQRFGPTSGSSIPVKLDQEDTRVSLAAPGFDDWTYTTARVPSGVPGMVDGLAVVHEVDPAKAAKSKLDLRPTDRARED